MKSILKSIRPKHTTNILNGDKIIEIDKSAPKKWKDYLSGKTKEKPAPIEVYIYCTRGNKHECLEYADNPNPNKEGKWCVTSGYPYANSKVVAKFTLNKVEEIKINFDFETLSFSTNEMNEEEILKKSCLSGDELGNYLLRLGNLKGGYASHIDNLVIFDKPKELSEFQSTCNKSCVAQKVCKIKPNCNRPLTKAPQSWCYIEVDDETLNQR